jgi:phage tail-like protein
MASANANKGTYYPPVGFYFQVEFNLLASASNFSNLNNLENTITSGVRDAGNLLNAAGINLGDNYKVDTSFQEVSGLKATLELDTLAEGGENRYKHQLPRRVTYEKLVLKRGLVRDSAVLQWCINALSNFEFKPVTLFVKLLNADGEPLVTWEVVNAIPTGWSVGNFNAEQNALAIEEMTLAYQYFNVKIN